MVKVSFKPYAHHAGLGRIAGRFRSVHGGSGLGPAWFELDSARETSYLDDRIDLGGGTAGAAESVR